MIAIQVFVGGAFGLVALFVFSVGLYALASALGRAARSDADDLSDEIFARFVVGLIALLASAALAAAGALLVRWLA